MNTRFEIHIQWDAIMANLNIRNNHSRMDLRNRKVQVTFEQPEPLNLQLNFKVYNRDVGDNAKGRILKRRLHEKKARQIFR